MAAGSSVDDSGRQRLFLLTGNDRASHPLPEPPRPDGPQRRRPILLMDGGRLAGLAWLEGDGERSWPCAPPSGTAKRWQAPQPVSHPGPGSQLGLTGAVLADGSWLLAWSAFDGTADEIVWSRRPGTPVAAREARLGPQRRTGHHARPDRHRRRRRAPRLEPLRRRGLSTADGPLRRRRVARRATRPAPRVRSTPPSWAVRTPRACSTSTPIPARGPSSTSTPKAASRRRPPSPRSRSTGPPCILGNGEVRMRWPSLAREETARSEKVP